MLTAKDSIRHHVDCMSDAEAEIWAEVMDAVNAGEESTLDRLNELFGHSSYDQGPPAEGEHKSVNDRLADFARQIGVAEKMGVTP